MNILAIGNSFSEDATRYLHAIAAAEGIYTRVVNLYIGGCSLERHAANLASGERAYLMEYNGESSGFFCSIEEALGANDWDFVSLQQTSLESTDYARYQPYLGVMAEACRRSAPDAKLMIHQTWAYEEGSERLRVRMGYETSAAMFADIRACYDRAASEIAADGIIPSGETVRLLAEAGLKPHRDTYHINKGFGRYALGLTWFAALTGADVTENGFADLDEEADGETLRLCRECAARAAAAYGWSGKRSL